MMFSLILIFISIVFRLLTKRKYVGHCVVRFVNEYYTLRNKREKFDTIRFSFEDSGEKNALSAIQNG